MKKIDYKKELKHLYNASSKNAEVVSVPPMNCLMIDGKGDPNTTPAFHEAVEALFGVSYTLKFMIKKGEQGIDYGVLPLEGLWWADDMSSFTAGNKDEWKWTMMIMQPEFISAELAAGAIEQVKRKKPSDALSKIRFEPFAEGRAAQIMHIGPFSGEGPTIAKLHEYIHGMNCELAGKHHEIYLSDVRKAAPEKWKTIIRQPIIG
ncbi:MAG: GyrI-like domain-containing protein [Nitrospirae bacterium]|nr:GyrI-like domain-containing protein [Nitrospirota bacterium]